MPFTCSSILGTQIFASRATWFPAPRGSQAFASLPSRSQSTLTLLFQEALLHCQVCPMFTLSFIWFPPPFFSVERNKRKALPTPSASHKPLPHPSTHSSTPPAPSAHSCSDRFLVLPPRPCGQVSGSLHFLEPQLHKEAWGQRLPAPKPQAPQLHSYNQQTAQGQAAFRTETDRRIQQILPVQQWLQSCVEDQSQGGHAVGQQQQMRYLMFLWLKVQG